MRGKIANFNNGNHSREFFGFYFAAEGCLHGGLAFVNEVRGERVKKGCAVGRYIA